MKAPKASTCESPEPVAILSYGKWEFADVILGWEIVLDYAGGPDIITRILRRGMKEGQIQEKAV